MLNLGLFEETALGLLICYVPFAVRTPPPFPAGSCPARSPRRACFQNAAFGGSGPQPRDMLWALPYSIFIFTYDEVRKLLMRKTGGQQREGCLYEYTVRLAHPLISPRLIPLAVLLSFFR